MELAQLNRNEARDAANLALESARTLEVDFLVDFYERCLRHIDGLDFGRLAEDDGIASRGRLMTSLMPDAELRTRMDLLLRSMEAVRASRRLSIMPGCKPKDRKTGFAYKKTVRPQPPPDFEREVRYALLKKFAPSKKILGLVDLDQYD